MSAFGLRCLSICTGLRAVADLNNMNRGVGFQGRLLYAKAVEQGKEEAVDEEDVGAHLGRGRGGDRQAGRLGASVAQEQPSRGKRVVDAAHSRRAMWRQAVEG